LNSLKAGYYELLGYINISVKNLVYFLFNINA